MKKQWTIFTVILTSILGLLIIGKIFQEIPLQQVFQSLQNSTPLVVWGFIIVSICSMLLQAWRWQIIIKTTNIKISFWKTFLYKIVGYGISFITPVAKVGGEPLRAVLLQREGASFARGFSTVIIDKVIELSTSGILFVSGIFIAILSLALPKKLLVIMIFLGIGTIAILGWFYLILLSDKKSILKAFKFFRLHKIKKLKHWEKNIVKMDAWMIDFRKHHTSAFNKAVLITIITWLLMFVEYKTALMILGIYKVSFAGLFLIITTIGFAYLIPVPLALGVLEAGQISTFGLLQFKAAAGVALSMIIRTRDLVWTVFAIIILLFFGFDIKKAYKKSLEREDIKLLNEKVEKLQSKKL